MQTEATYKTFEDLEFKPHRNFLAGYSTHAEMSFENGYGVSVITGSSAYSSEEQPYEVAILKDGELCYSTPITEDVIGYCDEKNVTDIMIQVQKLPNA